MTTESPINKKDYTFTITLVLLILSVFITWLIYSYNYYTTKSINDLKTWIEASKNAISELKKDEKVSTYNLLELNSNNIAMLDKKSNIVEYIEHFKSIKAKYFLDFAWFNYSDLKITTNVTSEKDSSPAYVKVANFIEKYRLDPDKDAKFKLPFINTITGQDEIKFSVNFEVK